MHTYMKKIAQDASIRNYLMDIYKDAGAESGNLCVHMYVCACTYAYTRTAHICMRMYTEECTESQAFICAYVCTYVCPYMYACM